MPKLTWKKLKDGLKVARWPEEAPEIAAGFCLKGNVCIAKKLDFDPVSHRKLKRAVWFVFAEKLNK